MVTSIEFDIRTMLLEHCGRESFRKPMGDKIFVIGWQWRIMHGDMSRVNNYNLGEVYNVTIAW